MKTHPLKLVTIICEALARQPVSRLLDEIGATGYTLFTVEGSGVHGLREGDTREYANIQIEVIVQPELADTLLARLHDEFFAPYAMIAYETDVRVLRKTKFNSSREKQL